MAAPYIILAVALLLTLLFGCGGASHDALASKTAEDSAGPRTRQGFIVPAPTPTATLVPPPTATPTPIPKLCEQFIDQDLDRERRDWGKYGSDPDLRLNVHDLVPGYGGLFFSDDGSVLNVWLRDASQGEAAKEALLHVYGDYLFEGVREFQILQGQYSVEQLYKWYFCMYDTFNTSFGIAVFYMDGLVNRIRIDHYKAYDVKYMEKVLERRGVPLDAVTHRQIVLCQGHTCHE